MNVNAWRRQAAGAIEAAGLDALPALEADVLLCHALGVPRTWLYAHADETPAAADLARAHALLERRLAGEPVAYLTGEREFRSRRFRVEPGVLIPRDDTDTLIDGALSQAHRLHAQDRHAQGLRTLTLVDAGTGSGIIAISLALELALPATVLAIERAPAAVRVARANIVHHNACVQLLVGDWLQALGDASVDLLVSNPPYVPAGDPHLSALRFEPQQALVSGKDGLQDIRLLIADATRVLREGGVLLLEHGFDQGGPIRALLLAAGFDAIATLQDSGGHDRVSMGAKGARHAAPCSARS